MALAYNLVVKRNKGIARSICVCVCVFKIFGSPEMLENGSYSSKLAAKMSNK